MRNQSGITAGLLGACALLLAGCGGGGGGGGGSGDVTDDGYSGPTTLYAMDTETAADDAATYGAEQGGLDSTGFEALDGIGLKSGTGARGDTASSVIGRVRELAGSLSLTNVSKFGARGSATDTCDSGTVSGTWNGSSPYDQSADGNYLQLTFNNCVDAYYGVSYNGRFRVTVVSAAEELYEFSFTDLTVANGSESLYFNGAIREQETSAGSTYTVATYGDSLVMGYGAEQVRLTDFRFEYAFNSSNNMASRTSDFTVASTTINGSITVDTTQAFETFWTDGYPNAGSMVITGAGGAKVRLTAESAEYVRIEYDLNGDGTYGEPVDRVVPWSEVY